jgi:DNA-binding Lrp family transcriptional regulator
MNADRRLDLLNDWQRGFPLVRAPFAAIGRMTAQSEARVIEAYRSAVQSGALSRIGGVFDSRAGGAGLLAAMAVPPERLDAVAAIVSAHPGVNHNYEREHAYNLWFVMTGRDAPSVHAEMDALEAETGLPALRLPMRQVYRIDLGFDLRHHRAETGPALLGATDSPEPLAPADRALAAVVESGLPLQPLPFDAWALATGRTTSDVLQTLQRWLGSGVLRRFGTVVRHHELGFAANAMAVFDVPDAAVDRIGRALAGEPGLTLIYRRERAGDWPYNLYCMVHGRDRATVTGVLADVIARHGLHACDHRVLFSRRRFKQAGARRFRASARETQHAAG